MFEVLLPSSGKKVNVRGLTLKEELILQSSLLIESQSLYTKFTRLAEICHNAIQSEMPLSIWLKQTTESDLHAICYGIYYDTYGPKLKLTVTCPNCNVPNPEIIVNLDKIELSGQINTEGIDIFSNTNVVLSTGLEVVLHPYITFDDQLIILTQATTEDLVSEKQLAAVKFATIEEVKYQNKNYKRPSYTETEKIASWLDVLSNLTGEVPLKEFNEKVNPQPSPYTLTFTIPFNCKKCKKQSKVELNFFRYLLESVIPGAR